MGLYKPTDLSTIFAEDIGQLVDVLTGQRDAGALNLLQPLSAPAAPSVSKSSGSVTGSGYQWGVYWITGVLDGTGSAHVTGRTPYGTLTAATSLSSQEATVDISALTIPTGAIGWGVARNKSPGGTTSGFYLVPGSEQFMDLASVMPTTYIDDTPDASLVTAAQTANTTGTTLNATSQSYTWLTLPISAPRYTKAYLAGTFTDTHGTYVYSWPIVFRDDLNSAEPWQPDPAAGEVMHMVLSDSLTNPGTDYHVLGVPPGHWSAQALVAGSFTSSGSGIIYVGTSSGGNDILSVGATGSSGGSTATTSVSDKAVAAGHSIHVTSTTSGGGAFKGAALELWPVTLAGVA